MGFGASVIPSMTTLGSAIRYSKEKRTTTSYIRCLLLKALIMRLRISI